MPRMGRHSNVTEDSDDDDDADGDEKQDFENFHSVDVLNVTAYSAMAVGRNTYLPFSSS